MTKEMTQGKPLGLILNFAWPLILGSILQQGYSLVDAAIVGPVSYTHLTLPTTGVV